MYVNLMPQPLVWQALLRIRARQWALAWCAAGALAVGLGAWKYLEASDKELQLAAVESRCQSLRVVESELQELGQELVHLKRQAAALAAIQPEQRTLSVLGIVSQSAKRAEGRLQLQRLSMRVADQPTSSNGAPAAQAAGLSALDLHGAALDDGAVARFVEALRSAAVFVRVELKSSSELLSAGGTGRQFQVECRF